MQCQHLHNKKIQYCQIFIDGVFIPMPTHVDLFCHSKNCEKCFQYMKAREQLHQYQQNSYPDTKEKRRQYLRFSQKWQLYITTDKDMPNKNPIARDTAQTIDISTGGFRLSSSTKLTPQERVHFIFKDAYSAPFSTGSGEIVWTKPDRITGGFQSGLALIRENCLQN